MPLSSPIAASYSAPCSISTKPIHESDLFSGLLELERRLQVYILHATRPSSSWREFARHFAYIA